MIGNDHTWVEQRWSTRIFKKGHPKNVEPCTFLKIQYAIYAQAT